MSSESKDKVSISTGEIINAPPPPVPSAPPSVGRVLALKYYRKVSKSLSKGFKKPTNSPSTNSSTGNTSGASSVNSSNLNSPQEDHNYEMVLHSSIIAASTFPTEESSSPISIIKVDESDTGGSVNESSQSEYGSAEDHFENESSPSGLFYENVNFSFSSKNQAESVTSNFVNPMSSQNENNKNTTPTPTNVVREVEGSNANVNTTTTTEYEDEEDDDSSKWDTSFSDEENSNVSASIDSNSKPNANSKSEGSNHSASNANLVDKSDNTTTANTTFTSNSNTTIIQVVHRPPPIPKFPSSTESSSTDESYSSCSSRPYGEIVIKSNLLVKTTEDSESIRSSTNNNNDPGVCVNTTDDDQATDVPKDNDYDDDETDETGMDEDNNDFSAKTASESEAFNEELVKPVRHTLTLTLNNGSNNDVTSLPPSSGTESKSTTLKRPETGPGDEINLNVLLETGTDPEYQNVFIRNGRVWKNDPFEDQLQGPKPKEFSPGMISANRVILSESGVTTIEEGHNENYNNNNSDPSVPVVHAVINLPPRMMNLIKQRRRKTEEMTYQKSSRLSRMMAADYKATVERPESTLTKSLKRDDHNSSDSSGIQSNKSLASKARSKVSDNVEKVGKSVSTMKRKMGSWYQRRVKTPVENLSTELGLEGIKFPGGSGGAKSKSKDDIVGVGIENISNSNSGTYTRSRSRARSSAATSPTPNSDLFDDESDSSFITGEGDNSLSNKESLFEDDGIKEVDPGVGKGQNEFEDLRRLVKQGGDFCKDLSTVLHERSELESQYAKGLSKLSAKLLKASKEATGSVAHAWQAVAVQIDTQAELHRLWSTALSEELARPLRSSTETQHKIRKSVEVLVEKTTKNLAEWRTAEAKAKRQCFSSSKEFEKLQESSGSILGNSQNLINASNQNNANSNNGISNNNANNSNSVLSEVRSRSRLLSVPPLDKDPMKLEAKRRKAEEAVRRADFEYYTFCVRSERARLEWEGAIRNGSTCLRTLEEEKLSLLRDLALKYFQNLNDFAPKLVHSVESLEEPMNACSVDQDMHSIVDIRRHVGAEQLLPDFYAEDTSNLMKRERRHEALQKFLYLIKQELERERKGAAGVETLAKAIAEGPKIDNSHHDISDKLYYMRSMLLYLEAARCKVDNSIADVEGRQRSNNPITQYMRHQRDKQGLPQTILKVPSWARDDCLAYSSGAISAGSSSPDWNDRGNADGTSGQMDTDFGIRNKIISSVTRSGMRDKSAIGSDEFGSEGSVSESNEEFGEEDSKVTNNKNLICVPSIGKCRAIYDYDASLADELTIRVGDEINIHDKTTAVQDEGWWLGELNGVIGIFPATYIEEIPMDASPVN